MTPPDERLARSARFWLRAYPRRWRAERADEVVALLADLAAPEARRLDVRTAVGLVAAGWATRWRGRPPVHTYLAYRGFDRRMPARYRAWAADDIAGGLFPLRTALWPIAIMVSPWLLGVLPGRTGGAVPWRTLATFAGTLVVGTLIASPYRRRVATLKHLLPEPGEPFVPGTTAFAWVARPRVRALSGLGVVAGVLLVMLAASVVAVASAPRGLRVVACRPPAGALDCAEVVTAARAGVSTGGVLVATGALVVGVLGAVVAARRLRRLVPRRPMQGARRLVGPTFRGVALVALPAGLLVAVLVAEATGRDELFFAPVVACVALVLAPLVLMSTWAAVRGPADLALVDVRRIALVGQPPAVDTWVSAPTRLTADELAAEVRAASGGAPTPPTGVPARFERWPADADDTPGRYGPFPPVDGAEGRRMRWLH